MREIICLPQQFFNQYFSHKARATGDENVASTEKLDDLTISLGFLDHQMFRLQVIGYSLHYII